MIVELVPIAQAQWKCLVCVWPSVGVNIGGAIYEECCQKLSPIIMVRHSSSCSANVSCPSS